MDSARTLVASEGKSDQASAEGPGGLSSEEVANRLYPKLPEPRKAEPPRKQEEKLPPPITGSVIAKDAVFDGKYESAGDLMVEGIVRGQIVCKGKLQVDRGATVEASVTAASVSVAGTLSGEVTCTDCFEALPSATVRSHVTTDRLIIQDGARFDGQVSMDKAGEPPSP